MDLFFQEEKGEERRSDERVNCNELDSLHALLATLTRETWGTVRTARKSENKNDRKKNNCHFNVFSLYLNTGDAHIK